MISARGAFRRFATPWTPWWPLRAPSYKLVLVKMLVDKGDLLTTDHMKIGVAMHSSGRSVDGDENRRVSSCVGVDWRQR